MLGFPLLPASLRSFVYDSTLLATLLAKMPSLTEGMSVSITCAPAAAQHSPASPIPAGLYQRETSYGQKGHAFK
eukprot:scaffold319379_cov13-Tisochrysis_lutea.AAC.1